MKDPSAQAAQAAQAAQSANHSGPEATPRTTTASANITRDKPLVTILLCMCYSLPLANAILSHLLDQPLPLLMTVCLLAFTLLWTLVTYSKRTLTISSLAAVGLLVLFIGIRFLAGDLSNTFSRIWNWILDFLDDMWWETVPLRNYGGFLTGLVTFLITLYAVVCSKKPRLLALGLLAVGVYCWEWYYGYYHSLPLLAIFLAAMASFYLKKVNTRLYFRARMDRNSKIYPLAVFPLCLILAAVSVVTPTLLSQREPVNLIGTLDITQLDSIADLWSAVHTPSEFQFYRTGFTDRNGKIGGDISLNKAPVLEVLANRAGGPLYLAGSYRDTYENNGWRNTIQQEIVDDYHRWKDKEKQYWLVNSGYMDSLLEPPPAVIIQPIQRQKVLFTPQNWLDIQSDFSFVRKPSDALGVEQSYKSAYLVTYHSNDAILSAPTPHFEFGSTYRKGFYKEYGEYSSLPLTWSELEGLTRYADSIRSHYLQLPDKLPERVKSLAQNIVANYPTDRKGDFAKVMGIMEYLSDYQYTLKPGPVPKGRDLVDYFLFDHKQGYCTYYATAMVVLCRSVGVPARYVEGYALDWLDTRNLITNEQAHTWVEVYLEGYGWHTMDPTAAARSVIRPEPSDPTTFPETTFPTQEPTEETTLAPETISPTEATPTTSAPAPVNNTDGYLVWAGLALLAVLLLSTGPYFLHKHRLKKLNHAPPAERMKGYFALLLELLQQDGVVISSSETALTLGQRLNEQYTLDGVGLYQIACLYCRYAYSDISGLSEEEAEKDAETIRRYYQALYRQVRQKMGLAWLFRVYFPCR